MRMLVAGKWRDTDRKIEVRNPFNDQIIDTVPKATVADVHEAIAAAASYTYHLSAWERSQILNRFCSLLMAHRDGISRLIAVESGKPVKEARIEFDRAYQTFLISAEEAKRINGEILPLDAVPGPPKKLGLVLREPIGIVVAITPFNYPLNLVAHKVGPAIAANNPVIVKPSSLTPLSAFRMAELFLEAGLPVEMLQVLTGDSKEIGDELVSHPLVQKVSFTGSVPVGKAICAKVGMKKIAMELGGNDPLILLEDADIDAAVPCAVIGAFGNNGQRCTSVKRIIVQERIADRFVDQFVEQTKLLRVGDPLNDFVDIGPLITEDAAKEVEATVNDAIARGATLRWGGERRDALYWPTILDHVGDDWPIVMEETFGPVAPVIRVRTFEDCIRVANQTPYGLQSGIFTQSLDKALQAAHRIQAGAVMINNGPGFRAEHLPFGGVKDSGLGREGVKYAIQEMTKLKTVVMF